jgi:hypothetical protein
MLLGSGGLGRSRVIADFFPRVWNFDFRTSFVSRLQLFDAPYRVECRVADQCQRPGSASRSPSACLGVTTQRQRPARPSRGKRLPSCRGFAHAGTVRLIPPGLRRHRGLDCRAATRLDRRVVDHGAGETTSEVPLHQSGHRDVVVDGDFIR